MHMLDVKRPDMPDLQFVLLVTALCTSGLTSLNVPEAVRITLFNRCWVLVHDSPPPQNPAERVLDLRLWTEVTLEAMVETIRGVLTEAGIRTLTWDRPPSDPIRISSPAARPLIDRVQHLVPDRSSLIDVSSGHSVVEAQDNNQGQDVRQLLGQMVTLMTAVPPALRQCAANIAAGRKSTELARQLRNGADVLQESGSMYLSWARHYVDLSDGHGEETDGTDEGDRV